MIEEVFDLFDLFIRQTASLELVPNWRFHIVEDSLGFPEQGPSWLGWEILMFVKLELLLGRPAAGLWFLCFGQCSSPLSWVLWYG